MVTAAEQGAAGLEPSAFQVVHLVAAHDLDIAAVAIAGALGGSVAGAAVVRYTVARRGALISCRLGSLGGVRRLWLRFVFGRSLAFSLVVLRGRRLSGGWLVGVVDGFRRLGVKRLPVFDRDLVVVGVDFVEGQEAVAIAAIVDECRLERGLHAHDLG